MSSFWYRMWHQVEQFFFVFFLNSTFLRIRARRLAPVQVSSRVSLHDLWRECLKCMVCYCCGGAHWHHALMSFLLNAVVQGLQHREEENKITSESWLDSGHFISDRIISPWTLKLDWISGLCSISPILLLFKERLQCTLWEISCCRRKIISDRMVWWSGVTLPFAWSWLLSWNTVSWSVLFFEHCSN